MSNTTENEPHTNNDNSATTETESFVAKAIDAAKAVEVIHVWRMLQTVMRAPFNL